MNRFSEISRIHLVPFLKKWGISLILLPFIGYVLHQAYWTLRFNIHFAISYNFPFPINFIQFLITHFLLLVHEAGHTLFGLFQIRFLTILGGSLLQLLIPGLLAFSAWKRGWIMTTQLSLYLLGVSFVDVAFYAADAGMKQLPLIGGLTSESHDWFNLLWRMGLIDKDWIFGLALIAAGAVSFLLALLAPKLIKSYELSELNITF